MKSSAMNLDRIYFPSLMFRRTILNDKCYLLIDGFKNPYRSTGHFAEFRKFGHWARNLIERLFSNVRVLPKTASILTVTGKFLSVSHTVLRISVPYVSSALM